MFWYGRLLDDTRKAEDQAGDGLDTDAVQYMLSGDLWREKKKKSKFESKKEWERMSSWFFTFKSPRISKNEKEKFNQKSNMTIQPLAEQYQ